MTINQIGLPLLLSKSQGGVASANGSDEAGAAGNSALDAIAQLAAAVLARPRVAKKPMQVRLDEIELRKARKG